MSNSLSLEYFRESIKSERTRTSYTQWLKFYGLDKLSHDPKVAQENLIDFIIECKAKKMSYSAIHNYVSAVKSYYQINDIILNIKKISRFMPEQRKVRKDRAYTHEEISKMLKEADLRGQALILILASSGCRIGAIPNLKLHNLDNYKLIIYENDKEEYYTFVSPECKSAIDSYLDMRSRYGEKLTDNSPLVREEFNTRQIMGKAKFMKREGLRSILDLAGKKAGVRTKEVVLAHGFRKFFTGQLINSNVKTEARLMLEGHSIGITDHYWRPTEQEIYTEYEKALDNLTINEENRLKRKVEHYESDSYSTEIIDKVIKHMKENGMLNK